MRVLVCSPTYRLEPETVDYILSIQSNEETDVILTRWNLPIDRGQTRIVYNYQKIRSLFLNGPWDALHIVESDIIPPPGTLERLAAIATETKASYVTGIYVWRHLKPRINATMFVDSMEWPGVSYTSYPEQLNGIWGQQGRISGLGFGCCLIMRDALNELNFIDDPDFGFDILYASHLLKGGHKMMADFGIVCGHKTVDGEIWIPKRDATIEKRQGIRSKWHLQEYTSRPEVSALL